MIILTNVGTSDEITVTQGTGVTSIETHCSWIDDNAGAMTPGNTNTTLVSNTAAQQVTPAVTSGHFTNIKTLTVRNVSATAELITISHVINGGTAVVLLSVTLQPNYTIQYFDAQGFQVCDSNGALLLSPATGRLQKVAIGSGTSYVVGSTTNTVRVRMVGGGGGGGGCNANAANGCFAGGGAGGGYTEFIIAVVPNALYAIVIGAGGAGGINVNNGNSGTATTWTGNASNATVVYGASGGAGGVNSGTNAGASLLIAGGGVATAANSANSPAVAGAGGAGGASYKAAIAATVGWSGMGGDTEYGQGGASITNAAATAGATGTVGGAFGGGGAGGGGNSNSTGGAGAAGLMIVEEYS